MLQMLVSINIKRLIIRYVVVGTKAYIWRCFLCIQCLFATEEQRNLCNVQFWPESLGAMLEY